MGKYPELEKLIKTNDKIVFFGGAGVSTESGIPDFRSSRGLYSEKYNGLSPEEIVSHSYYSEHTEDFFDYYRKHLVFPDVVPNDAHLVLKKLEDKGKISAIVTQNIDGLHQKAGSKKVYELHGSVLRNICTYCGKHYGLDIITESVGIPCCKFCGHTVKPDVTLYEESLPEQAVSGACNAIAEADLLIIAGTSLAVYPAASFITLYRGKDIVLINLTETPYDHKATLVIHDKVGAVLRDAFDSIYN